MAGVNSLTLVSTLICLSVVAVGGTSPPLPPRCPAPPEGQIYYPGCAPCDGTCENPNPPCLTVCAPGCACPKGQVIKDGKCIDKTECPPPACPVIGQIYYPGCAPCDATCRNPIVACPAICRPGCACPAGQVIMDRKACVNKTECPQVCPIEGQIYYPECAPCNGTCENPNIKCPKICKPGCACPRGQVVKDGKKCVDKTECPPVCPIKGQKYYPECAPCNGTCENPNPPCPEICKPGCACPRGKVVKNGRRCVNPDKCGEEACSIKGQIYYPKCAPCDATCENPDVAECQPICKPGCACPRGKVIKNGKRCVNPKNC